MSDYLQWQSSLSAEKIFSANASLSYPCADPVAGEHSNSFLYATQLLDDKSRSVVQRQSAAGIECLTPAPFNLRTKINEYGGKPYWVHSTRLYFANNTDQCLYRQEVQSSGASLPQRISPLSDGVAQWMYADVVELDENTLLAVAERAELDNHNTENVHQIVLLDLRTPDAPPWVLAQGASFYSNLVYHPESQTLAWIEWDHPQMPWDANRICVAQFRLGEAQKGQRLAPRRLELASQTSVCQLCFVQDGRLFYVADQAGHASDSKDFWNVYCYDLTLNESIQLSHERLEMGYPHWQYGDSRLEQLSPNYLIAIASAPQADQFLRINLHTLETTLIQAKAGLEGTFRNLSSNADGQLFGVVDGQASGQKIIRFSGKELSASVLLEDTPLCVDVSLAEHFAFNTSDGESAYGFYYPPQNKHYADDASIAAPPLIVMVHGGPTARAYGHFDVQKQFWTSRGFALLDVNHRGSSGYGRTYRDALYGNWGEVDTADIIAGVAHLVEQGKADSKRICIRGKSAGGYAVLCALTQYPDVFKAGACYYGIGNLATLAEVTHKFEKHYTDRLISEAYVPEKAYLSSSRYYQRSPIYELSKLSSSMIVFQGLQDKVVPPSVAQEIIGVLKAANVPHKYVEYPDEAHGFKQLRNNVNSLELELKFYQSVLN